MPDLFSEGSDRQVRIGLIDGTTNHDVIGTIDEIAIHKYHRGVWLEIEILENDSNEGRLLQMLLSSDAAEVIGHSILAAAKIGDDPGLDGATDNKFTFKTVIGKNDSPFLQRPNNS